MRTRKGIEVVDQPRAHAFFYGRVAYMMFVPYPGTTGAAKMLFYVRGDGVRIGYTRDARGNLISLIYGYAGTRLTGFAQYFISHPGYAVSPHRDGLCMDVLWARPDDSRRPLRWFRLSHHALGQGVVLMRADWTDQAAFGSFICGDHYCYHQHADAGSFTIVRHGAELAVDSGQYDSNGAPHMSNYQSRVRAGHRPAPPARERL